MAVLEHATVTLSHRRGDDGDHTVVWLRGEHDVSTVSTLSDSLAWAITLDDADVVVDLSGVRFMGVVTVEVLLQARERLRLLERSMTLRSPSRRAERVLGLCGVRCVGADPMPTLRTSRGEQAGSEVD